MKLTETGLAALTLTFPATGWSSRHYNRAHRCTRNTQKGRRAAGGSESTDAWGGFLDELTGRGLRPPLLLISDGAAGLINACESSLPRSLRQRCLIHRCRNYLAKVPAHAQQQMRDAYWAKAVRPSVAVCTIRTVIPEYLRSIPTGVVDVTAPVSTDGLSYIDPHDPAMAMYRVLANLRQPVALRDLMIAPVRSGYIGDGRTPDPALVPASGAEAVPDVDVDEVYLPVTDGVARCQLYRPTAAPAGEPLPMIVYYHGGGFTVGTSDDCDFLARKLAYTNSAVVVSANYRSAPEFPFPTPFNDAFDVYRWVTDHGHDLGGDPSRIAVAGDSAGSTIAAAIPLRARHEAVPRPGAVVLLGAFTDFQYERWESFLKLAPRGIVYDMAFMGFIRAAYVCTTPWNHPWVSPIEGDLAGYPLAVVTAGTHDPLVDSAKAFAQRVRDAGGRTVDYFPAGLPHGYYFFPGIYSEEEAVYELIARALAGPFGR